MSVAAAVGCAIVATGCGPGLQDFSVGRSVSGGSYPITAVFNDASNLPVGGHVELHDVSIGRVESLETRDFKAYVHLAISSSVKLPVGTRAQLALTTPLGEEYVNLVPPAGTATAADLTAGSQIGENSTSRAPDVEDLLSAFSAILNGGGIDQVHTILDQLNKALNGRTQAGRSLIAGLNSVLSQLAGHTTQIDATLASINAVAKRFAAQRQLLARALVDLSPGIKALSADTAGFTRLVTHLARLGRTATDVLDQVQATLVSDIKGLSPTLDTLVALRGQLRPVLVGLREFAVLLDRAIPGDFLNLRGSLVAK